MILFYFLFFAGQMSSVNFRIDFSLSLTKVIHLPSISDLVKNMVPEAGWTVGSPEMRKF